ncbi:MAG TPA: hypothetical protein VGO36_02120 [Solirubrobacterales bacterium]|jgi:hypothetical protein|nr:hypothetical protein [Solirubrobacterales bacterium]
MTRNLTLLATALAATSMAAAALAGAAFADTFRTTPGGSATVTGTQGVTTLLKTTGGSAECKKATYKGTTVDQTSEIELTPTFSECTCLGVACTIDMNSCRFRVSIGSMTIGAIDIVCPESNSITFTNTKCTIHLDSPSVVGTAVFSNIGSGTTREIKISYTFEGAKYTHTKGAGVGACTSGSGSNGTGSGTITATGETDGGTTHVELFVV